MKPFALLKPATLREASMHIGPDNADAHPLGGGTAIMLMMKAGVLAPSALVSLRDTEPQWRRIDLQSDGALHIGSQVTLSELEHSPQVQQAAPSIARCMVRLSNVRVRNVATVGGALAHGDPHMDLPPLLCALGARVRVTSGQGEREIALPDLIAGYYETTLRRGELIAQLIVPPQAGRRSTYVKVTTRAADDWPALGIAVSLALANGVVRDSRLFVGAATDHPTRLDSAEGILAGQAPSDAVMRRACKAAAAAVTFRGDERGSGAYKKELLQVHLLRALRELTDDTRSGRTA